MESNKHEIVITVAREGHSGVRHPLPLDALTPGLLSANPPSGILFVDPELVPLWCESGVVGEHSDPLFDRLREAANASEFWILDGDVPVRAVKPPPIGLVAAVSRDAVTASQRTDPISASSGLPILAPAGIVDPIAVYLTAAGFRALLERWPDLLLGGLAPTASRESDVVHAERWRTIVDALHAAGLGCYVAPTIGASRSVPVACEAAPFAPPDPRQVGAVLARLRAERMRREVAPILVGVLVARVFRLHDLRMLRASVARTAAYVTGLAVVLVTDLRSVHADPEFLALRGRSPLSPSDAFDLEFVERFIACGDDGIARHTLFGAWVDAAAPRIRGLGMVDVGAEHNAALRSGVELAKGFRRGGDLWILAINPGESIDPRVSPAMVERLIRHPDPSVVAYDVVILTAWDAPNLYREDPPFGDGGSWRGGPSEIRIWRDCPAVIWSPGPVVAPERTRIANLRILSHRILRGVDRLAIGLRVSTEGMRLTSFSPQRPALGIHFLAYRRESVADLARWASELFGLVDPSALVIVWTEDDADAQPSVELVELCEFYGIRLVWKPLQDNLAAARNAGISALTESGVTHAGFFDPDEWLLDPLADGAAIRRILEGDRNAWIFRVANHREGADPSFSESVRVARSDLRMNGRVHEGFGAAFMQIRARGAHPRVAYAPPTIQHRGMNLGDERTREKLDRYADLLYRELRDDPRNTGAWCSLALHLDNDGYSDLAEECMQRAVACSGESFLAPRELGLRRLREGIELLKMARDRMTPEHTYYRHTSEVIGVVSGLLPKPPRPDVRGTARDPKELPPFDYESDGDVLGLVPVDRDTLSTDATVPLG